MRSREFCVAVAALSSLIGCAPENTTPSSLGGIAGTPATQGGSSGATAGGGQAGSPGMTAGGAAGTFGSAAGSAGSDGGSPAAGGGAGGAAMAGSAGSGGSAGSTGVSLTDEQVWPMGVNGPQVWPPELDFPWYSANKNNSVGGYPEGGDPPPLDLLTARIQCKSGSKVRPVAVDSAPWEQSRWHPPEYAFDEYSMSRWSSNGAADNWLSGDLGSSKKVSQVFLIWEVAFGKDYDIQFSDDNATWTTAKEVRNGNGQADVVELVGTGRDIRRLGVATGTPSYGYSRYELTSCAEPG